MVATQPGSRVGTIADLLDKLSRMNKSSREKILSKMPEVTRQRIEKGLEQLDAMGPIERQEALGRFRAFRGLDSRGQEQMRAALVRFGALPDRRRRALRAEISAMNKMPKAQREQHIGSEDFQSRFSADERSILQEIAVVMPPF